MIFCVKGDKASESDPRYIESSDQPIASGLPFLAPASKSKFLKIQKKKIEKEFISMASMNCWIYEDDIGKACSFLISNDSERISGQTIPIDGNAIRLD